MPTDHYYSNTPLLFILLGSDDRIAIPTNNLCIFGFKLFIVIREEIGDGKQSRYVETTRLS